MIIIKTVGIIFLSSIMLGAVANNTDTATFFKTTVGIKQQLSADKVYPRGTKFPFSFYSIGGGSEKKRGEKLPANKRIADQQQLVDCGITMIGPQYELNDIVLADAKKFNLHAIYTIFPKINGEIVNIPYFNKLRKSRTVFDMQQAQQQITSIVKKVAANHSIGWWDITPEELRHWFKNEMKYLKMACQTIRQNDPLKRPIFMYQPGHRPAKELAKTSKYLDIIGKGMYPNYSGLKTQRIFCRWTIEQELEAIKILGGKGKIPIAVPEMFQQPSATDMAKIPLWVRHDVYCALVAGAKGVVVFSASKRAKFKARTKYLTAYMQVCRELQGDLGQAFLFGQRKDDLTVSVIDGPENVTLKFLKKVKTYPAVSMVNIAWKNSRYVVLVNSAEAAVEVMVDDLVYGRGVTVMDLNTKDKFTAPEANFRVDLPALGVKLFKIYNAN